MRKILFVLLLAGLFTSCKKASDEPHAQDFVSTDILEVNIGSEGGTETIQFSCSGDWYLNIEDRTLLDWCTPEHRFGQAGNNELLLYFTRNHDAASRRGTIVICSGNASSPLEVVQSGREDSIELRINHSERDFSAIVFYGNDMSGSVNWGDGESSSDITIGHYYGDNSTKTTRYSTFGVESFHIKQMNSISSISIEQVRKQ